MCLVFHPGLIDEGLGTSAPKRARALTFVESGAPSTSCKKPRTARHREYTLGWFKHNGLLNIHTLVVHAKQIFRLTLITLTPYLDHDDKLVLAQTSYETAQARDDMINKAPEEQYTRDEAKVDVDQSRIIGVVMQNFIFKFRGDHINIDLADLRRTSNISWHLHWPGS